MRSVVGRVDYEYNRCPNRICHSGMDGVAASVSCGIVGVGAYVRVGFIFGFCIVYQTIVRKL